MQAPQSPHAKDDQEERKSTDREQCPDKEEISGVPGDAARATDALAAHVHIGHEQPEQSSEQENDVPREAFPEQ